MSYVIDPQFSVYKLVERVQKTSTVINHRRTMSLISYEIENSILLDGSRPRLFSAFQYLSKFMKQRARYEQMAKLAESIYVFGVPDVTPPSIPNVHYIHLKPTDRLAKEWFIVAYGGDTYSALATEELTQITDPDAERRFKGIWTFNQNMVSILHDWLSSAVDAPPLLTKAAAAGRQIDMMAATLGRITRRLDNPSASQPVAVAPETVKTVVEVEAVVAQAAASVPSSS